MGRAGYSLFKRQGKKGDVWYVRFWSEVDQKYVKTESLDTSDHRLAERRAKEKFERGVIPNDDNPFIADYVREFWRDGSLYARHKALRGRPLSPRYIQLSAGAVRLYIEPWQRFQKLRVAEITPGIVDKWLLWLQDKGKGTRTMNIALQALRVAVRRWARSRRLQDPLEGYQKAAENTKGRGALSLAEVQALIECRTLPPLPAKKGQGRRKARSPKERKLDPRARVGVLLSCLAGLRLGECRGLRWEDVNEKTGVITVKQSVPAFEKEPRAPKWGSTGEVPVPSILLHELKALAEHSVFGKTGYVLYSEVEGQPVGTETLRNGFERMMDAIGIDKKARVERRLSFHSCRHTFVSLSRLSGIPDFLVQRYARHRSPVMMETYSHSNILDIAEARKMIDSTVGPLKSAARRR